MSPLKLAYLSLTRKKLSSFIALAAIAISVATSGVLLRLYLLTSSRFSTIAQGGDAIIGAKSSGIEILLNALNLEGDYPGFLPQKLFESLQAQQRVKFEDGATSQPNFIHSVIPFLYFAKLGPYRVIGTDEHFFTRPRAEDNLKFSSGGLWVKPTTLIIGSALAKNRGLKVGDSEKIFLWAGSHTLANAQGLTFEIAGILEPTQTAWDYAAYVPYQFAQSVFSQINLGESSIWQNQVLNYFLVYLDPHGRAQLESLINKRTVGQIVWVSEEKAHLEKLTGTGQQIGFLITALVMLLGGLGVTAMMTTRFDAMNVQIAVVRAIGYTRAQISLWLFFEGLLLGVTASFIGALLDWICFPIVKNLLGESIPNLEWMQSQIWQSSSIWFIAILATIAALFLPMLRLVNQNIHDQLKGL